MNPRTTLVLGLLLFSLLSGCIGEQETGQQTTAPQAGEHVASETPLPSQEQVIGNVTSSLIDEGDEVEIGEMI